MAVAKKFYQSRDHFEVIWSFLEWWILLRGCVGEKSVCEWKLLGPMIARSNNRGRIATFFEEIAHFIFPLFIQLIYFVVFHVTRHQPIAYLHLSVYKPHTTQFLDSLQRRANARNVSFWISFWRWPIHIINLLDKTKLSYNTPHRRITTVSLEIDCLFLSSRYFPKETENGKTRERLGEL